MSVDPERVERIVDRAEYVEECILKLAEKQDVGLEESQAGANSATSSNGDSRP